MKNQFINRLVLGAWMLLISSFAVQAQDASPKLYGVTFFSNELIAINDQTGEGTLVAPLGQIVSAYGIAARYGRLYAFNPNTQQIVEINPASGKAVRSISIGVSNLQGEGDLAFRNDGVGFLASVLDQNGNPANDLYSFDVIGGTSSRIGTTTVGIDGLAFDSANVFYAVSQGALYTINQTTAAATLVGDLGIPMNSPFGALTFAPNGVLYASVDDRLYAINKLTGAATVMDTNVLDFGFSSVSGLAYQSPNGAPKLYGSTFFGNELIVVDPATGEGTHAGSFGSNISPYGLAARTNRLYSFNPNTNRVVEISPATGNVAANINIGVSGLQGEGDLAFRSDGIGFLASALDTNGNTANDLYSFNVDTGTSTRVGSTAVPIDALAFDTNDTLYALGQDYGKLYIINTSDAATIEVGSLGVDMNSPFAAMAFSPDGKLYAAIDDRLFEINKFSGAATPVNTNIIDIGFSSVSGLTFAAAEGRLSTIREGSNLVVFFFGEGYTLETADVVTGPYIPAPSQLQVQRFPITGSQKYFRLRK